MRTMLSLSHKRTLPEALVFYLVYLIATMLVSMALGWLIATVYQGLNPVDAGRERLELIGRLTGSAVTIIVVALLGTGIIRAREELRRRKAHWLIVGAAVLAAVVMGAVAGLVFVAVLSVLPRSQHGGSVSNPGTEGAKPPV